MNISRISNLEKQFNCPVVFSDHTIGTLTSITALALGAKVIEKHFTLDKKMKAGVMQYLRILKSLKKFVNMQKKLKLYLVQKKFLESKVKKNL